MGGETASQTSTLPPDPGRLIQALRSIGYSLNSVIADLVDNSVDAEARNVLVRFWHNEHKVVRIVVADASQGWSGSY